jgi:mRNA-decapping enzyme subunit 2
VQQELDAAGVARDNADTFGATFEQTAARGFSADEMFKVNAERFNIHSTYSFDQYTTALPGKKDSSSAVKGVHAPERFRPCAVLDAQTKLDAERANKKTSQGASGSSALLGFTFDSKSIMDSMGF